MTNADIWETYSDSWIVDAFDQQIIWSGPNAVALPLKPPVHVITAHNPYEQKLSVQDNDQRNSVLLKKLEELHVEIKQVIGLSPDQKWQEASYAVQDLSREQACAIAQDFQQRGIFELADKEVLVIDVATAVVKKKRKRVL